MLIKLILQILEKYIKSRSIENIYLNIYNCKYDFYAIKTETKPYQNGH